MMGRQPKLDNKTEGVMGMPIFEYECEKCGAKFEELISSSKQDEVTCPECGSREVTKLFSTFSGGSGTCSTGFGGT